MDSESPSTADVPVAATHVEAAASRHGVEEAALRESLATIHRDLVDDADAIHGRYESTTAPDPIPVLDGLATVLFVDESTWDDRPTEFPEAMLAAAKTAHAAFARDAGADPEVLDTHDPLVVPSETVGQLVRAGLSHRQAQVQTLHEAGLSQTEIAERLGVATNTVKVHRHRIDTKVENARQLLCIVE